MASRKEMTEGGVLLTEGQRQRRDPPSVGAVLAAGAGVPLSFGQTVVFRRRSGKKVKGFDAGDGPCPFLTVFFGREGGLTWADRKRFGTQTETAVTVEWSRTVMATVTEDGIAPTGKNVLVSLSPKAGAVSGVLLPDTVEARECLCTVMAVGPDAKDVEPGDTVVVHEGSCEVFSLDDGSDVAILPDEAVLCKIS